MDFVKLTVNSSSRSPVYVNVASIEAVYADGANATIGITSHNNGGIRVVESQETVMTKIREALAR